MRSAAAIDTLPAAVNVDGGRQLGMPAQVSCSLFVPRTVLFCPFYGVPPTYFESAKADGAARDAREQVTD